MKSLSGVAPAPRDCSNPQEVSAPAGDSPDGWQPPGPPSGSAVRRVLANRFVRFLLVGGLNTLFGYGVFTACILAGIPYPVSAFLSTVLGVLFNFKSYGMLVFGSHDNRLILRFFLVYGACYLIGLVPLAWAKAHGVPILLMAAVCAVPMAALAFVLQRAFVFHGPAGRLGSAPNSGAVD